MSVFKNSLNYCLCQLAIEAELVLADLPIARKMGQIIAKAAIAVYLVVAMNVKKRGPYIELVVLYDMQNYHSKGKVIRVIICDDIIIQQRKQWYLSHLFGDNSGRLQYLLWKDCNRVKGSFFLHIKLLYSTNQSNFVCPEYGFVARDLLYCLSQLVQW